MCCIYSVQFSSVTQSCPTLCNPMNRGRPGLPVHHHLPEFTQTHVHRVSHAIQPSHHLLSPSPPAPNPSSIRVFSNESTLCMRWPHKGISIRITADLSTETIQARRGSQDIIKVMKENNQQPRLLYPARIPFKYE